MAFDTVSSFTMKKEEEEETVVMDETVSLYVYGVKKNPRRIPKTKNIKTLISLSYQIMIMCT